MAQIVYHRRVHGFYPALMLDDVLSELDEAKRAALINFLHEINTQIFITTTDIALPERFALENYSVMNIKDGALTL
jgi:DNA replication and repair protein RecF